MICLLSMQHPGGALHWGRVSGTWGLAECTRLLALLAEAELGPRSRVILDFSETDHLHYRAVPALLQIAARCKAGSATLRIVGLSDYLKQIVEVASALAGRDFVEEHIGFHAPLLGPAGDAAAGKAPGLWPGAAIPAAADPHGFDAACLN